MSLESVSDKNSIAYYLSKGWLVAAISLVFLLPARFFINYSLAKDAPSNIVVNYLNAIDAVAILLSLICILVEKDKRIERKNGRLIGFYLIIVLINTIALLATSNVNYFGELVSKIILLIASAIIAEYLHKELDDRLKLAFYLIPILVLVFATFFLRNYGGYATSNRVGTLGFGSNETAMFACALIGIALISKFNMWIKLGLSILGLLCVLTVSSRRGIAVALALIAIYVLIILFGKRKRMTVTQFLTILLGIALVSVIIYINFDRIYNYVMRSPLLIRFSYSKRIGIDIFDTSDRSDIFRDCMTRLNESPFLGFMGSDKLFAQGSFTHTHNLLLQFIVIYGYFFGSVIAVYFIASTYKAIRLLFWDYKNQLTTRIGAFYSIFFLVYFVFDMYGYLLWNPKGILWVMITSFLISKEYREQKHLRTME